MKHSTGETLLETIIAVSILTLILMPAAALFMNSQKATALNRNDLIASGLAEEALEMLLNFRDSNLLKFSPKTRECWNTIPGYTDLETCHTALIEAGKFILTFDPDSLEGTLESVTGDLIVADNEEYRLRLDVQGSSSIPDCRSSEPPPSQCYHYTDLYFTNNATSRGELSPFYRKVEIEYVDTNSDSVDDKMIITAVVQYRNGSTIRTINRAMVINVT